MIMVTRDRSVLSFHLGYDEKSQNYSLIFDSDGRKEDVALCYTNGTVMRVDFPPYRRIFMLPIHSSVSEGLCSVQNEDYTAQENHSSDQEKQAMLMDAVEKATVDVASQELQNDTSLLPSSVRREEASLQFVFHFLNRLCGSDLPLNMSQWIRSPLSHVRSFTVTPYPEFSTGTPRILMHPADWVWYYSREQEEANLTPDADSLLNSHLQKMDEDAALQVVGQNFPVFAECDGFVWHAAPSFRVEQGTVCLNALQRFSLQTDQLSLVTISAHKQPQRLGIVTLSVLRAGQTSRVDEHFDCIRESLLGSSLNVNDIFCVETPSHDILIIKVIFLGDTAPKLSDPHEKIVPRAKNTAHSTSSKLTSGCVHSSTKIILIAGETGSKSDLSSQYTKKPALTPSDWDKAKKDIGGATEQISLLYRRALLSRTFPPDFVKKMGIKHVKGVILYGPPGTGKTLIARQIAKSFNGPEPKIINGPELLNMWLGQSEKNVRDLFEPARQEFLLKGDESRLHLIVIDELDALCRSRDFSEGLGSGGHHTAANIVNQFLSMMDGVDSAENVLLIGMTNRLADIDPALRRPGRFEVEIEVTLPDLDGRKQIFDIHTSKACREGLLSPLVNTEELAKCTEGFSGADISGVCNSATSLAMTRFLDHQAHPHGFSPHIEMEDFLCAISEAKSKEPKTQRGQRSPLDEQPSPTTEQAIFQYNDAMESLCLTLEKECGRVLESGSSVSRCLLLVGERGAGKSALSKHCSALGKFACVKTVSTIDYVGSARQAWQVLREAWTVCSEAESALLILDDLDAQVLSQQVLMTLMLLMRHGFGGGKVLLVATTSTTLAFNDKLLPLFDQVLSIPLIHNRHDLSRLITCRDDTSHESNVESHGEIGSTESFDSRMERVNQYQDFPMSVRTALQLLNRKN